jgi:hypothetical protein
MLLISKKWELSPHAGSFQESLEKLAGIIGTNQSRLRHAVFGPVKLVKSGSRPVKISMMSSPFVFDEQTVQYQFHLNTYGSDEDPNFSETNFFKNHAHLESLNILKFNGRRYLNIVFDKYNNISFVVAENFSLSIPSLDSLETHYFSNLTRKLFRFSLLPDSYIRSNTIFGKRVHSIDFKTYHQACLVVSERSFDIAFSLFYSLFIGQHDATSVEEIPENEWIHEFFPQYWESVLEDVEARNNQLVERVMGV